MKMKVKNLSVIFIIIASISFISASVPQSISVHGKLTDSSGNALSGNYNISFSLYNISSGGTPLYQFNQTVDINPDGSYDTILENVNLTFDQPYFLGINVNNNGEMTPRLNLTSSPYSLYAQNVSLSGVNVDTNLNLSNYDIYSKGYNITDVAAAVENGTYALNSTLYSNFVQYSGASQNVSIGNYNLTANYGSFSYLGLLTNPVLTIFVNNIYAENITSTGTDNFNITNTYFNITNSTNSLFYVNATTGDVGIGTTSPNQLLSVVGNAGPTTGNNIEIQNLNSSGYASYTFGADNPNYAQIIFGGSNFAGLGGPNSLDIYQNSTAPIAFFTNGGTARMFINGSTGDVGIGTTTPAVALDVHGPSGADAFHISNNAGGAYLYAESTAGTSASLGAWGPSTGDTLLLNPAGGNISLLPTGGGNVGIGTTTPSNLLSIAGSTVNNGLNISNSGGNYLSLFDDGNAHIEGTPNSMLWIDGDSNAVTSIGGGGGNTYLNQNGGNVGIGTTSPSSILQTLQTSGTGYVTFQNTGGTMAEYLLSSSNSYIGYNSSNGFIIGNTTGIGGAIVPQIYINGSTGDVGIGTTTPADPLDINGYSSGGGQLRLIQGNYGVILRNDGGSTYFLLTNSGDQYGTWNSLRPLSFSDSSGLTSVGNGLSVTGGLTADTASVSGNLQVSGTLTGLYTTKTCTFSSGTTNTCSCPAGYNAIGGGANPDSGGVSSTETISQSYPSGSGWVTSCMYPNTGNYNAWTATYCSNVYVVCMKVA